MKNLDEIRARLRALHRRLTADIPDEEFQAIEAEVAAIDRLFADPLPTTETFH